MSADMLPDPTDPLAGPFWAAAREHRLTIQRCSNCGNLRWPPLRGCPDCLSRDTAWVDVDGAGTVWSYAVYHRALHPAFGADVPYTVGVVALDAGPQVIARLVGGQVAVGDRVDVEFDTVTDAVTLPRWRPISGSPATDT